MEHWPNAMVMCQIRPFGAVQLGMTYARELASSEERDLLTFARNRSRRSDPGRSAGPRSVRGRAHSARSISPIMSPLRTMSLLASLIAALGAAGVTVAAQCPKGDGYFAHERNCDMYYQCENGTRREGVCPDGLVFDDRQPQGALRCDLPFDIDCSYRSGLQPPLSSEHCPRLYGLYAHEADCGKFWQCVEGHPYAFRCPEGLAYNEYSAHCDWPDQVENCDSEAMLSFRCPQPTDEELQYFGDPRYAYPGDCRKHYVCVLMPDGSRQPRLLACDPGLVFNQRTSSCDDPENVPACQDYYNNLDARRLRELFGR